MIQSSLSIKSRATAGLSSSATVYATNTAGQASSGTHFAFKVLIQWAACRFHIRLRAIRLWAIVFGLLLSGLATQIFAQQPPQVAYAHPAGVPVGATTTVHLGGFDLTPDAQFFVLDPRVKMEVAGPPSEMLVAGPPYWFGAKARAGVFGIPREVPVRLTIPADMPPGPIHWQIASANGASSRGTVIVGGGPEMIERRYKSQPQLIPSLPMTISGQVKKIAEVDQYLFTAAKEGPITIALHTRQFGSALQGMLTVVDPTGKKIANVADTLGKDVALTFSAKAGGRYMVALHDVDYRGNRAFTYRLSFAAGPRVITTVPAFLQAGQTQSVTFIGRGVATGSAKMESVTRQIKPPAGSVNTFAYQLETKFGVASRIQIPISRHAEKIRPVEFQNESMELASPGGVTAKFSPEVTQHRFHCHWKKGQVWNISAEAERIGSPLDISLSVHSTDGKQLATADDSPGTTDAHLTFTVPTDGRYELRVVGLSGATNSPVAIYHLAIDKSVPDFHVTAPDHFSLPMGGTAALEISANRTGGHDGPIQIGVSGLPKGVTTEGEMTIPSGKKTAKITFKSAADGSSWAALIQLTARSKITEKEAAKEVIREIGPILLTRTMKPRAKVTPVDKDGGRTVHRGTTYPAEVIVERLESFTGPVLLQMASLQGRHRQGIRGHDVAVAAEVTRIAYPVYMPEWLETSRTSRMVLNAVTKISDPKGNVRYLSNKMDGRITMSLEGALLKLSHPMADYQVRPDKQLIVPFIIRRSAKLPLPVRLELVLDEFSREMFRGKPIDVPAGEDQASFPITFLPAKAKSGMQTVTIRAIAMQAGNLPVVSETQVEIEVPQTQVSAAK